MLAQDTDEVLSFGTYPSSQGGPFQPHASLNAQANGSLAVQAGCLNLLPSGGETIIGSGRSEPDSTVVCACCLRSASLLLGKCMHIAWEVQACCYMGNAAVLLHAAKRSCTLLVQQ